MGFVYRIALSRFADGAALGLNSLVMQVYQLLYAFCITGLNVAVTAVSAKLDEGRIPALLRSALTVYIVLWMTLALPTALLAKRICAFAFGCTALYPTLILMLLCILLTGMENVLKSIHIGTKRVNTTAASELLEQGARFVLTAFLLNCVYRDADAKTVLLIMLGMTCSECVSVSFLSVSFYRRFRRGKTPRRSENYYAELTRTAFPASLCAAGSTLFSAVCTLMLPGLLCANGADDASALYQIGVLNTAAVPVVTMPLSLIGALASVLMPEVASISNEGGDPFRIIKRSFTVCLAAGVASSTALVFCAERLCGAVFGVVLPPGLIPAMLWGYSVAYARIIGAASLNGLMMQKELLVITLTGDAFRTALTYCTVPFTGIVGFVLCEAAGELMKLILIVFGLSQYGKNGMETTAEMC